MRLSRRRFLGAATAGAAGAIVGAPFVRSFAANAVRDKVRVAVVGVAGQGAYNLGQVAGEEVVALCEIDEPRAAKARQQFPRAKFFTDYRKMLDDAGKGLDAVVVATPDHTHAHAGLLAMAAGKHLYCEKPLARSVHEARRMRQLAGEKKLVTQMGTQIHAGENYRRVVEIVRDGAALGEIRHVHVWCSRTPDAMKRTAAPVPGLAFDLDQWLGPVPADFFYADGKNWPHFDWRWWWAFGGGVLADMGCHFMDLAFWALGLTAPTSVKATGTPPTGGDNTVPRTLRVDYEFPVGGKALPLTWHHGVTGPDLAGKVSYPGFPDGVLFEGAKASLVANYGAHKWVKGETPDGARAVGGRLPKSIGHHLEWLEAIRGNGKPLCDFAYSGQLTEAVLLGNVAYRTGEALVWDGARGEVTNTKAAAKFVTPEFRKGWEL